MEYKVVITSDAEEDLDRFVRYLLFVKQNPQAATNVLNDFEKTKPVQYCWESAAMRESSSERSWIQKDAFPDAPVFYALSD